MPPTASTARARGRHRKPRPLSPAARRAIVIAAAAPIAGTFLTAPSAFAAGKDSAKTYGTPALDPAEQQIAEKLNARVQDPRLGDTFSGVVIDSGSDNVVWSHGAENALMPASNTKLATATAALTVLGPDHTFTTKVVYGDGTLTLVGGGDRTLTIPDVEALAKTAVDGLKSAGLTKVKIRVDDSLFPEPTLATGWNKDYFPDTVAPVRPLVVDGRTLTDTSLDAGKVFAKRIADRGITVDGEVTRGVSGKGDVPVAQHSSAKLSEIVKHMLKVSDNNIAETLLRMTALGAGRPATFEDGAAVVRDVLSQNYGVSLDNFQMHDGSGLSRATRIPAQTLADILDLTVDPRYHHTLKSIKDGLPVAGEEGASLGPQFGRFDTPDSKCAVGKVMAKTGTLSGAIALSGFTKAEDGRWKVFSFIENGATAEQNDTKDALDGLAATVNGCWA
ncbi:D-alanyl-D-alanine carboxypeptidase/D-alanyl-D-alanine-endopeptidase [Streptomyces sp. HD1123-B1]|uniref:D-alanyl-D-alanine carboxypeptidase/D-alanyl-D-alanine endopeptidase n=1 Tax=Streptomyces huangiella TaxID=3228804 RepID=UPI003D7EAC3F